MQYCTLEDTVYCYFALNDTAGSGADGGTPVYYVRKSGSAASAAPLFSATPDLLSHASYPAGLFECAVPATAANSFTATNTYAVFATAAISGQNPSGLVDTFKLDAVPADIRKIGTASGAADKLKAGVKGNVTFVVGAASTTTSVVTSSMSPACAVADQFKDKIITFADDTTTVNLRGQTQVVSSNTSGGVLTVPALTTAPVSGDTGTIA
jgi:hypothetical protein